MAISWVSLRSTPAYTVTLELALGAAELTGGLGVPAFEGALEGFGGGEAEQVGNLAEGQFGVADIGHGQVAAGVVENAAELRAFLGQLAPQGPGGRLQARRHFFQVGFPAVQQRSEQLRDALAQAAGAG